MLAKHSIQPLSTMMADELKNMDHHQVLNCLKMIQSKDIGSFNNDYLELLYERYT